mmetsp:Transcript_1166/g.1948  ORF Transcript_1166/g.1948 Transcript_1166/m.1948 type:complete len:91 (-) Transcript_1166:308-580(-)
MALSSMRGRPCETHNAVISGAGEDADPTHPPKSRGGGRNTPEALSRIPPEAQLVCECGASGCVNWQQEGGVLTLSREGGRFDAAVLLAVS